MSESQELQLGSTDPLLQVSDLEKSYPSPDGEGELAILKGVNLRLQRAESVAILGQSGAGKSTLLHILGTLDHPSSGSLRFCGKELFSRSREELAHFRNHSVGFVFQFHHLLPEFSALENTMMPGLIRGFSQQELVERASTRLADVGLSHRVHHQVGKLSGGERQRVALARATVMDPPLVLADEPTGNLDLQTGEAVGELLVELNQRHGITFVVVTHNQELAGRLGRTLQLVEGRLV